MSDLHRAVEAELDAHRPTLTPPFEAIRARKRARDQRRAAGAAALSVVAVLGVAFLPSSLRPAHEPANRTTTVAGPTADQEQDQTHFRYGVNWTGQRAAYSEDVDSALHRDCFALGGVTTGPARLSLPPRYSGTVTSRVNAEALRRCVAANAPGANFTLTPMQDAPHSFLIRYKDPAAFNPTRDNPLMEKCLNLAGISDPKTTSRPPVYNVTAAGAKQADALSACLARLKNVTVVRGDGSNAESAFIQKCVGGQNAPLAPEWIGRDENVLDTVDFLVAPRVIGRDGKCLAHTHDLDERRIKLIIRRGKIIWAGRF